MDDLLFLTNPLFRVYSPVTAFAVLLFLAFYITTLISQAKKISISQPASLPVWFNIMYPTWLDKLTLRKIVMAFARGLCFAVVIWMVLAAVLLAILAKVYGP